jgi:hypothetical protein
MMKIEISFGDEGDEEEKPMPPTPFQRKVAKMLAQRAGRKKVSEMDMKMAADLEEDAIEGESKS